MPLIKDPAKRDANARAIFGCTEADAIRLNDGRPLREKASSAMAYVTQRHAANGRGIEWLITFPEWLGVWTDSGLLALRGVGVGRYCMARRGDEGPYAVSNVSILSAQKNSFDGGFGGKAKHAAAISVAGRGRGWTFVRGRFQVVAAKKYVGRFTSQAEAEAAYQIACAHHNASKGFVCSHHHFFTRSTSIRTVPKISEGL